MDAAINRFIHTLRRSGIGVSPAESIDAMRALAFVALADRETTKTVLRATLIKNVRDEPAFDALFGLFFGPPQGEAAAAAGGDETGNDAGAADGAGRTAGQRVVLDTEDDGLALGRGDGEGETSLKIQPGSLEQLARNLLVKRAEALLDPVMQRAAHQVNVRSATARGRAGELNFSDGQPTLDADLVMGAFAQLLADVREIDPDGSLLDQVRGHAASVLDALPEALRRYLQGQLALQAEQGAAIARKRQALPQDFSEAERREMDEIVRRLGRRLRGGRSYRRHVSHRGRISVARTVRSSMIYDGIPFNPVLTSQRRDRPRIVVICDVSLSVRNTARFMLHLVYSLQSLFEQVRSYVFVSELADTSQIFEDGSIDAAITAVFDGTLIDCDADSNYGRAFGIFCQRHLAVVTRQTTVVVLGDGRGNRNPPNVAALEDIRRRARQLIWLSPEPRGSWGLGSSDMLLYEPVCHRTEVVRNLKQLGHVADGLLLTAGARSCHATGS